MGDAITAEEAARRLGVSRQTLYAYVSRGLLRAAATDDPRRHVYDAEAVEILARDRHRGRRPKEVARTTLDWGLPVLESRLTLVRDGRLYYRGVDAVALSRSASLEDVAALLWDLPLAPVASDPPPPMPAPSTPLALPDDILARFAGAAPDVPTAYWQQDPARLGAGCLDLVRGVAAAALGSPATDAALHRQMAARLGLDDRGADLLRRALVLACDHELNVSAFSARCVASAGASLKAAVIAGLAALSGARHGGMTARVSLFWQGLGAGPVRDALRRRLASGEDIPGLGHPLYPDGDIRAQALLAEILPEAPDLSEVVGEVRALTGRHPTIDFALVALCRHLGLPEGTAFALFAVGRTVGWIAHALEQRADGQLIRPRALYLGPEPGTRPG